MLSLLSIVVVAHLVNIWYLVMFVFCCLIKPQHLVCSFGPVVVLPRWRRYEACRIIQYVLQHVCEVVIKQSRHWH